MNRFDPREWTLERLTFSGYRLLGQFLILSGRRARPSGYDEAVLVRKPGRNPLEIFSLAGLLASLYGSALIAAAAARLSEPFLIALAPVLPFATLAVVLGAIIIAGTAGLLARRLHLAGSELRASGFVHLALATATAAALAVGGHWTRWVGIAWFALFAVNIVCALIVLLLRPVFRRVSAGAWRNTPFVD